MASESALARIDLGRSWYQTFIEGEELHPFITTRPQTLALSLPSRRLTCFHSSNNLLGKLSNGAVVSALIAYSKGQLALAPCTDCQHSYEDQGSAMPFPDCVFLPMYWNFACASCIARGRASRCSFHITRAEYRDVMWETARIRSDDVGLPDSKWLRRADPLSTYGQANLHTIWIRRQCSDAPPHDLKKPLQDPCFVFPPDVPNAKLPERAPQATISCLPVCRLASTEHLDCLRDKLRTKKNIVLITGAGISTNTGIPDFRSSSRLKTSSRNVFDASAYATCESTDQLHDTVSHMLRSSIEAKFTAFDLFAEDLARSGRLWRQYTQNIDTRHARLDHLSRRTLWLHGRADILVCHSRPSHLMRVTPQSFSELVTTPCPTCELLNQQRAAAGKRAWTPGFLRPKVLLYGEPCLDETEIMAAFKDDLAHPVDAVLIVGTRLSKSITVRNFVKSLCEVVCARDPGNLVVWVSKESPQLEPAFISLFNYEALGDCDGFASMMSD